MWPGFGLLALSVPLFAQVQTGTLPHSWTEGSGDCMEQPAWTVRAYNEDLYILRQSGCAHYEKPFLYLIFGVQKALLLDTGAGTAPGTAAVVRGLLERHAKARNKASPELIAVHSHGHGDHTAGDAEVASIAHVVPANASEIAKEFNISNWPVTPGVVELGDRAVDVLPIPGHDAVSIALYDRKTGVLLTGDSLYPGRLYVTDWEAYRASIRRLKEWTHSRPVAHVLGAHIEQMRTPFRDYTAGTTYQPHEHTLELGRAHLLELDEALSNAGHEPKQITLRDFTVVPRRPQAQSSFVSPDFTVPAFHSTKTFKLVPLGPALAELDYRAYMSSIDHLRKTFGSGNWPHNDLTMVDALKDVEGEIARFHARSSFTYAVLNLAGTEERGCVYISP
ncbi:MAG TPA: MBL fold metallo-hydrolase, partial [Bryobacteraceae bacterium]|nr:MBL fold metallo-hydrolase [Bryobacteraceae bacterium]